MNLVSYDSLPSSLSGWLPEFSNQFSIVDFSDEYRSILIQVCISYDPWGNVCFMAGDIEMFLQNIQSSHNNLFLSKVLITDAAAAFFVDRILLWLAGEGRLNIRI